jgi:polysaccharide biosynthesis transport protein
MADAERAKEGPEAALGTEFANRLSQPHARPSHFWNSQHMSTAPKSIGANDVIRTISEHPRRLVAPIVVVTLVALFYALFGKGTYEVSQALVVRDETGDPLSRPGKFAHTDEMKASQETIVELLKSRNVLSKALAEVGPPIDANPSGNWPSDRDVEQLQAQVKIVAPKGAEFGKTEVFYLKVQSGSQQRAKHLAEAICRQLQVRFSQLREAKANSTINELTKTVALAKTDLAEATKALSTIEGQVARDLAELRILNESPSGDSDLRRTTTELERELRTYRATQTENEELLKLLKEGLHNPDKLLASPAALLKSQPGLGRLKDGLVDAQLKLGNLKGTMSEDHPMVQGARAAQQAIRQQLHDEISVAISGVEADQHMNADRIKAIEEQQAAVRERFARLASVRAEYSNLVSAAKNRSDNLKLVEHKLAEARGSKSAAASASLINLVDSPDVGTRPIGPARSMIVLGGVAGGLLIGLAWVVLSIGHEVVPQHDSGRFAASPNSPVRRSGTSPLRQALQRVANYGIYTP